MDDIAAVLAGERAWAVLCGDALEVLRALPDGCVHCCITSPPYYGLRDYGTGRWEGGDPNCRHQVIPGPVTEKYGVCRCGASRIDGQIGLEESPGVYVARLVEVFAEVRRVLRPDGTLWLNLGDSYNSDASNQKGERYGSWEAGMGRNYKSKTTGLKPKDLLGIPWRVAFALQSDGWYLRSDIIWSKPNPMPESVTDRPTKAHEYLFLLAKGERYFYDAEAIKEPAEAKPQRRFVTSKVGGYRDVPGQGRQNGTGVPPRDENAQDYSNRNRRSVWEVATQPYPGAHFATFPEALVEPCILAGCSGPGKHCDCDELVLTPTGNGGEPDTVSILTGRAGFNRPRRPDEGVRPITRREQRAYAGQMKRSPHRAEMEAEAGPPFAHYIRTDRSGARPLPPELLATWLARGWLTEPPPCDCPAGPGGIVLDPFAGSGTTLAVALRHNRRAVGIELNPEYVSLIDRRIGRETPLALFSEGE